MKIRCTGNGKYAVSVYVLWVKDKDKFYVHTHQYGYIFLIVNGICINIMR